MGVVVTILAGSIALGGLAASRYIQSEDELTQARAEIGAQGQALGADECIDLVLKWRTTCGAMKSLCESSVFRMMEACLDGRDRTEYCTQLGTSGSRTSFGKAECKARGLDRAANKACAAAYRAIDAHCKRTETFPREAHASRR